MLSDVLPYLRCPVCGRPLATGAGGRVLRCRRGHAFDVARHGYVHLAAGELTHPGDSAAMVADRSAFLATGGYDFLATALAAAAGAGAGLVLDAGAGTGYYLARVLAARPAAVGLAVDASAPAVRRAARAHPRAGAVRADLWRRLPVADGAAAVLLNVFAPRNGAELARVLASDGMLLVATPTAAHLAELADRLGAADGVRLLRVDPEKPARVAATLDPWFVRAGETVHTHRLSLTRAAVGALVGMGPSSVHTDQTALARAVAGLPEPVPATASVRLARYVLSGRLRWRGRPLPSRGAGPGTGRRT